MPDIKLFPVRPQAVKRIKIPCLLIKHVDNDFPVIQVNPGSGAIAFHIVRAPAQKFQLVFHFIRKCFHLSGVIRACNDKIVSKDGQIPYADGLYILRRLGVERVDRNFCFFSEKADFPIDKRKEKG